MELLKKEELINRNKKIIEIIFEQIKEKCPDSIDMIAIGGSFCNGDIYEKSDLDLVIISRDDKAKCLDKCFILDDVAMDVYTHDWTSFEQASEYSHPYVTKLIEGYTFMFFKEEGWGNINIKFVFGNYTMVNISIPKGSLAPEFGEFVINLHKFNSWKDKNGNSFDFTKPLYTDTVVYGDYEVLPIADYSWINEAAGTENDPYIIKDKEDLYGIAAQAGLGNAFKGKVFKFDNPQKNIDMSGSDWVPIPSFAGTILGNNNTISNLTINTSKAYAGLFSTLSGAKISELKFNNVNITANASSGVGVVAGTDSSSIIEKVLVENATIVGQNNVGGIVGIAKNSTIDQCVVRTGSKITANATDAGGIVAQGGGKLTMSNLYSDAIVTCPEKLVPDIGGILGNYDSGCNAYGSLFGYTYCKEPAPNNLLMNNLLFEGKIDSSGSSRGAIFGRIGGGGMGDDSYSNDINSNKSKNWFYNSDNIGSLNSTAKRRGTAKTPQELQTRSTYNNWIDFDTYWNMTEGSYPTLKWLG